jgi:F420-dependent methylenetetrahydromethanopterin dehydrogenase
VGVAEAAHARGSHGSRLDVVGDGAAIAPDEVEEEEEEVEEEEEEEEVEVVVVDAGLVDAPVDAAAGGVVTVNCVPVTTVTSAPSVTWLGS